MMLAQVFVLLSTVALLLGSFTLVYFASKRAQRLGFCGWLVLGLRH